MSSATGVNLVKYFFYTGNTISGQRKRALVALAYAAARDQQLAPKKILIRADIHDTTTINGTYTKDLSGWHGTFAFKDSHQVQRSFHVTTHGYTNGKEDFALKEVTHSMEKKDSSSRRRGKVVWPEEYELEEYKDSPIAYSHLS
ncbi:hypothetical protein F5Y12DRAFT_716536 [Xylaria sp. FL1777]|nr:hypothetical protein F5Y12DRAFT_716536 [Xylaria sp. FL1777]